MRKISFAVIFLFLIVSICSMIFGQSINVASPQLVRPTSEVVDLTGKDTLEFKWLLIVGGNKAWEYYDFRLYKGYQTLESTLLHKEKIDGHTDHVILAASMFQDGQVYTWTLRRLYRVNKSDRSRVSFKVIKK